MTLKIQALHVGTLTGFPAAAITYHRGFGETIDVAMIMFLITGGDHPVIVDTGTGTEEFTRQHHGYELVRPPEQEPLAQLERVGVDPADVGTVVNTHLHWDHCSNNDLFPNARIVVQKAELEYAVDPLEPNLAAFERLPGITPPWTRALDRIDTVVGDEAVPAWGRVSCTCPGTRLVLRACWWTRVRRRTCWQATASTSITTGRATRSSATSPRVRSPTCMTTWTASPRSNGWAAS